MCSVANPAPPAPFAWVGVTLEDGGGGDLIWVCEFNRALNPVTSTGDNCEFYLDGLPATYYSGVVDGLDNHKLRITTDWPSDPFGEAEIYYELTDETIQAVDGDYAPAYNVTIPSPF